MFCSPSECAVCSPVFCPLTVYWDLPVPDQVNLVADHDDRLGVEVAALPQTLQQPLRLHQTPSVRHTARKYISDCLRVLLNWSWLPPHPSPLPKKKVEKRIIIRMN